MKFVDKKYYVSDLTKLGVAMSVSLESDSCVTVTKGEPYKISASTCKEILAKWSYGFGKVEQTANGFDYFTAV